MNGIQGLINVSGRKHVTHFVADTLRSFLERHQEFLLFTSTGVILVPQLNHAVLSF